MLFAFPLRTVQHPQNPWGFKSLFQHKNRQHTVVLSIFMAERGGFYSSTVSSLASLLSLAARQSRTVCVWDLPALCLSSLGFGRLGPQNPWEFKSLFQHKNRQHTVVLSIFMAEREGFEPSHGNYPPAGIRSQSLQPLGYLSTNDILETNDQQGSKDLTRN